MNDDEIAAGNDLPFGEDDTQYMQTQDPGYAIHMLNMELAHVAEERSKFSEADWEKLVKEDEIYFIIRDDIYGEGEE